jgi:tRNA(Arg) A34 adenosine deaminase TadA
MAAVIVDQQTLIDAYNQAQRASIAVGTAIRHAEQAAIALAEAQREATSATEALTTILRATA